MRILNLTQHNATPTQINVGVYDLPIEKQVHLRNLLTFEHPSEATQRDMRDKARTIASFAHQGLEVWEESTPEAPEGQIVRIKFDAVMIGGAPYFMSTLERVLKEEGFKVLYSFSERVSVEIPQPDGSVKKVNTFNHAGWIEA